MFGPLVKPAGGNIMAHAPTTRVHLKKGKAEQRIAKLVDSPCIPEADALYMISSKGRSLDVNFIKCST
jgi:DNA repair protein RAD51